MDQNNSADQKPDLKQQQIVPWWNYLIWLLLVLMISSLWLSPPQTTLSYNQFKEKIRSDEVASVTFQGDQVAGELRPATPALEGEPGARSFSTTLPPLDDPELITLLQQHDVTVYAESEQANLWTTLLIGLIPWLLLIGLFWYASTKMSKGIAGGAGSLFDYGKSKARKFRVEDSQVTFEDVAGLENAKADLREITSYLKNTERYKKLGAKIPRGILLMGPPGTGKTLLARAVAGEANVPFFSISGSEFIEMFVGVGASRVRDMFESAKKEAPSIIFIDEIDSVGRARGTGLGGGHDEREQTLNQILGEMDGFDPHVAVVVLAATNRPDVLDSALLRPGRFDRKVTLDLPDKKARIEMLKIHSREVPLADDADLDRLAALTVGFSGADLENLVNEAALLTGRENREQVNMAALLGARDKIVLGGKREMVIGDEEKRWVAYHESGHALLASLLPSADPPDKVTIIPRGHALGATEQIPGEDRHNLSQRYLHDRIGVMLGGRVSEKLVFGEVSNGAEQDLLQATRLARHMVARWGMSERLGPIAFHRGEEHVFLGREMAQQQDFSDHTAQIIDEEIGAMMKGIEQEMVTLLSDHRPQLDALVEALLEKETLEAAEIRSLLAEHQSAPQ